MRKLEKGSALDPLANVRHHMGFIRMLRLNRRFAQRRQSTLFNALTKTRKAEAANYPFCTIDPNVGVVQVPDATRTLAEMVGTSTLIPAAIEMVDIAGLVAGASKGEGLGNKFLANVREVDAIAHVVRCFEDEDVIHNMGRVDPIADAEVIMTELILADAESASYQLQKNEKKARGQDKDAAANAALLERLLPHLNEGKPANLLIWMRRKSSGSSRSVFSVRNLCFMPAT